MTYEVQEEHLDAQPTLSVLFRSGAAELGEHLGECLPKIHEYATENGGTPAGAPYVRYHSMDEDEWEIEAGIPLESRIEGSGEIAASELPAGPAAVTVHKGPYAGLGEAHDAVLAWIDEQELNVTGAPWDAYVDDPADVPSDEVRTRIVWPVDGRADASSDSD